MLARRTEHNQRRIHFRIQPGRLAIDDDPLSLLQRDFELVLIVAVRLTIHDRIDRNGLGLVRGVVWFGFRQFLHSVCHGEQARICDAKSSDGTHIESSRWHIGRSGHLEDFVFDEFGFQTRMIEHQGIDPFKIRPHNRQFGHAGRIDADRCNAMQLRRRKICQRADRECDPG